MAANSSGRPCGIAQVAYLEQMVAESGSTHAQPATLHTRFPAVPSPSPHKDLALSSPCITPSGAASLWLSGQLIDLNCSSGAGECCGLQQHLTDQPGSWNYVSVHTHSSAVEAEQEAERHMST